MKISHYLIAACTLFSLTTITFAGRDPIGWSQSGSIPATTQVNQSYSVNFTLTNNLPFTMPTALEISNNSSPLSEVTMIDGCSGSKLASKQTCSVGLVLTPTTAGTKTLSVYMEYGKNKVQIPQPVIKTYTASGANSLLEGRVALGFPKAILSNTTYSLEFDFMNNSSNTLNNLNLSQKSGNSAGYTQTNTNCTSTLAPGASCYVTGSFTTSATSGDVHVGYTLANNTLSTSPTTSAIISSSGAAVRTFTIINNCSQTVWFGFVGGAVNTNACTSDSQCGTGSSCDPAANSGAGECFYNNPVPTSGSYQLTHGSRTTVPIVDYGLQYVWSGNVAARTGASCATGTCQTADCQSGGGDNACPVGQGFAQPATLSEFTLLRNSIDSYDISILNGTNVAAEITPTTHNTFNPSGMSPAQYNCTSPGNPAAANGLGACSWSFSPPNNFPATPSAYKYKYVQPAVPTQGLNCTDDTSCTGGNVCGLYYDKSASPTTLKSYCGTLIGYDSANQVCSFANTNQNYPNSGNNLGDPFFSCDSSISGGTGDLSGFTNWAMYACKAQAHGDLGTCYNTSANPPASTANCCGCINWQDFGFDVPSDTATCVATDTAWGTTSPLGGLVLPGIEWIKTACPTAYSYPFDDKASSFGCDDISGSHTTNTVNYTITFCPS